MKKKLIYTASLVMLLSLLPAFAKEKKAENTVEETENTKQKKNKKETKENTENTEEKKNYAGWIDTSGKDIDFKTGIIHLKVRPKLGTFNLQVINDDGRSIPVLSTANEFTTTGFFLKYNKKAYKLEAQNNIKTGGKRLKNGVELEYSIENVADIVITMTALESEPGNGNDLLKVNYSVINRGPKKALINQKVLLDTILGETDQYHFYTSASVPVTNEVMYRTMQNEKWFMSKNNQASMQILLNGADITDPYIVALANYSTLSKNTWEPEMLTYRAFDTVLSYNNSAVGVYWPEKSVAVNGKVSSTFYISLASGQDIPQGYAYIQKKDSVKQKPIPEVNIPVEVPVVVKQEPVEEVKVVEVPVVQPTVTVQAEVKPAPEPVKIETPAKPIPNVKFDVSTLTKEQLTPEYIQNLLDRILALEESDTVLNREELLQLNAELDAILESLR